MRRPAIEALAALVLAALLALPGPAAGIPITVEVEGVLLPWPYADDRSAHPPSFGEVPPAPALPAERAPQAATAGPEAAWVLVLGSFKGIDNARRLARRWSSLSASIVPGEIAGIRFFRVVAAPTDLKGLAGQKRLLFDGGGDPPWLAPLCARQPGEPDCVRLPAAIRAWRPAE